SRIRGTTPSGAARTGRASRRAGPRHRDRGSAPRSQAPGQRPHRQPTQTRWARRRPGLEAVPRDGAGGDRRSRPGADPLLHAGDVGAQHRRHRQRCGEPRGGPRRGRGADQHAVAAGQYQSGRRPGGGDSPGGQRPGAASIPFGAADHDRRASSRGSEGLSRRAALIRPRRCRLRDRPATAGAAVYRRHQPRTDRPDDHGRVTGAAGAAAGGCGSGGPDRGAVAGLDHPHAR
ncbi:hypothetical protein NJB14194_06750, partial [Mycobacterium montefiorense]